MNRNANGHMQNEQFNNNNNNSYNIYKSSDDMNRTGKGHMQTTVHRYHSKKFEKYEPHILKYELNNLQLTIQNCIIFKNDDKVFTTSFNENPYITIKGMNVKKRVSKQIKLKPVNKGNLESLRPLRRLQTFVEKEAMTEEEKENCLLYTSDAADE